MKAFSSILIAYIAISYITESLGFNKMKAFKTKTNYHIKTTYKMTPNDIDINLFHNSLNDITNWIQLTYHNIADTSNNNIPVEVLPPKFICPGFGQPGWIPFCFPYGNPIFNTFDVFQEFIQNSVVSLHDFLQVVYY